MTLKRVNTEPRFFLDEGGIYEEGMPGQIFDHPQRERTRQFIGRLRVSYPYTDFDPLTEGDPVSAAIIRNAAADLKRSREGDRSAVSCTVR